MEKCEWDESLETGITDIDIQHRVLFNILKILVDSLENNREDEVIDGILKELSRYTKYHTVAEAAYHIGSLENRAEHEKTHKDFITKVDGLKKLRKTMNNREFGSLMAEFICYWIEEHIRGMDMRDLPRKK